MGWILIICRAVVLVAALLLASCTVQSNQLGMLTSAATRQEDELAPYRWQVEFGVYRTQLIAVVVPDGTLFGNDDDDLVAFDGWLITEVQGFGLTSDISIVGQVGERMVRQGSSRVGSQVCEDWQLVRIDNTAAQEQECVGEKRHRNRIALDSKGSIIKIEQYIGIKSIGESEVITLTKI